MRVSLSTETIRVHLALFVTMMIWGVNLSAVKGLTEDLDLILVASVRMVLAALVLAVIARFFGGIQQSWQWKKWQLLTAAAFFSCTANKSPLRKVCSEHPQQTPPW